MTKGVHRVAAGTKTARKLMAATSKGTRSLFSGLHPPSSPADLERWEWNRQVELKKVERTKRGTQ